MLALVALDMILAGTTWHLVDLDCINVTCGSSEFNHFLRDTICIMANSIDDEHSRLDVSISMVGKDFNSWKRN